MTGWCKVDYYGWQDSLFRSGMGSVAEVTAAECADVGYAEVYTDLRAEGV